MTTVLTHAIVGAALAPLAPADVPRKRLVFALVILSVLPDLDVLAFSLDIPYDDAFGHRGFTHSFAFALLVAWLVARFEFTSVVRYSRTWWHLFLILSGAMFSHGLLDALTNGGLGVGFLIPLSQERFFFPVRPFVVSSIGWSSFMSERMFLVYLSEIRYAWIPLAVLFSTLAAVRKLRRRKRVLDAPGADGEQE